MILPNARRAPRHGACRHQGARRTGAALPNDGSGGWAGLPRIDTHDTLKERPEALRGRSGSRIIGRDRFIVARLCGHTNIGPVSGNHRTLSRGVRGPQRVPCRQGETGMILKGTATPPTDASGGTKYASRWRLKEPDEARCKNHGVTREAKHARR